MPQPEISPVAVSTTVSFTEHTATLYALIEFMRSYEPALVTMIEQMCGIYKRVNLHSICNILFAHSIAYMGGGRRVTRGQTDVEQIVNPLAPHESRYVVNPVVSGQIERHADYIIGKRLEANPGNMNVIYQKRETIKHICQGWGLDANHPTENTVWAKNVINNQIKTECTVLVWKVDPVSHDNIFDSFQKEIIEIVIPKQILLEPIWEGGTCVETQENYIKMFRGHSVGYITRPYLNEQQLRIFPDYEFTPSEPSAALTEYRTNGCTEKYSTILDRYYDRYVNTQVSPYVRYGYGYRAQT